MVPQYASYSGYGGSGGSGGVATLNGESGNVTLVGGTGISVTPAGQNITITNTSPSSGGTVTSVSVVSSNGLAGTVATPTTTPAITLSTTVTGILQGNGTAISAATTGNLTDVGTDGITITGGTGAVLGSGTAISQHVADATHNGYLSSADWVTFNAGGSGITSLTGDVTATGPGSAAATLATVNGNVGTFGSSTSIPTFTVNAKGLITAASGNVVIAPAGTLSGTTLNATVVSSSLTSVGTITSGTWNGTTIAIANGGTGQATANAAFAALSPMTTAGDLIFENATPIPARLPIGTAGQVLTVVGGLPAWAASGSGSGTVTSVAFADGSTSPIFSVSGSPITTSGTITETLVNQSANTIFSGPTTGAAAQPTFRALVNADLSGITLPVANGGTGDTSFTANQVIIGGTTTTSPLAQVPGGTAGFILTSNGTTAAPTFQPAPGTVSAFYASSQVTTTSTSITSTSFVTFSNSPAFTFTPSITGTYKVYSSMPIQNITTVNETFARISNTSGGATLLQESQAEVFGGASSNVSSVFAQSVYTLTAGTAYIFDIQGKVLGGGEVQCRGGTTPFYMFAELEATGSLPLQVSDINGLNGSLTLAAGTGLSLGTAGNTLTFSLNTPVSIANGGTNNGSLPVTAGGVLYTDGSAVQNVGAGTAGQFLTSNGASPPTWTSGGGGGATFQFFASSPVTTDSSSITGTSFSTFDNSPAFTFTPTVSGTYKVYCSAPLLESVGGVQAFVRIIDTSGSPTLLNESYGTIFPEIASSVFLQNVYTLVASTTYVFDVQGRNSSTGDLGLDAAGLTFCMFAEQCG